MPRRLRTREIRRHRSETSQQASLERYERKFVEYKDQCFKGQAVVRLSDISTGQDSWHLTDDGENVTRISHILEIQGCLRLSKQFHVPVIVASSDWSSKVFQEESSLVPALNLPQLGTSQGYSFIAVDHRSLIIAAQKRFRRLGVNDPWWVIDIYVTRSDDSDVPLRTELHRTLQENFLNERRPSDGRIYRNIRFHQGVLTGVPNKVAEDYWWAVLEAEPGSRKGYYLWTLPEKLQNGFDCLLPISGIWAGMNIGVLHKLRAMKCDEPLICYLEHIRQTFLRIVDGNADLLWKIDSSTVNIIKSRAPKVSGQDMEDLQQEWDKRKLFRFMDEHHRNAAWERLKEIDFLIPTLETFFQDVLFLEVGQTVIRQLCLTPPKGEGTIDQTLRSQYMGYPPTFVSRTYWDRMVVDGNLCDLWRFSLQYAFEMTNKRDHHRRVPRKSKDKARAVELGLDEWRDRDPLSLLDQFLALASRHEFQVPFPDSHSSTEIPRLLPYDFPPQTEGDIDIERRCGKPFTDSIDADVFALSREALSNSWSEQRVSAGFVRRCVFLAFFSYLNPVSLNRQIGEIMETIHDNTISNWEGGNLRLSTSSFPDIWALVNHSQSIALDVGTSPGNEL